MTPTRETGFLLDLLRLVAAQAVLLSHAAGMLGGIFPLGFLGQLGVLVFFFLSGFLIALSADNARTNGRSGRSWVLQRFSRIYSVILPGLVLIALLDAFLIYFGGPDAHPYMENYTPVAFLANMLMLNDYYSLIGWLPEGLFKAQPFGTARPLWTIGFEWWLYMAFGMLFFLRERVWSKTYLPWFLLAAYVPFFNLLSVYAGGLTLVWAAGAGLYFVMPKLAERGISARLLASVILLVLPMAAYRLWVDQALHGTIDPYDPRFMLFVTAVLSALVALTQLHPQHLPLRAQVVRVVRYMAGYSFSLYVLHFSFILLVTHLLALPSSLPMLAILLAASNLLAAAFAHVTERRHRMLFHWLEQKRARLAAPKIRPVRQPAKGVAE